MDDNNFNENDFNDNDFNKNHNKKNYKNKTTHSLKQDYNTLGFNSKVEFEEVRKSYLKLLLKHHPDKGGDKVEFQKINEAYLNIANKKIKDDDSEDSKECSPEININEYKISKSDIKKYEDHLKYKRFFTTEYNYHDIYFNQDVIRPFKLFFNIQYESLYELNDNTILFDEMYVNIVDMWNNLSRINKRKYRGMVNTIDLYKRFETVEQLKRLLN
jgi:hypothetical protein